MLCELCNGAYHLACIEGNYSKGLPRVPTDDEWFCKGCVKRGIPETIIDRVGRGSSAHYLVKWFGRDSSEVSWEDATTLDTAWSRKQIAAFVVAQEHAAAGLLLPPCHPLIDRKLEKKEEEQSPAPPSAQKGSTPSAKAATPAPASAAPAAASSPSASAASSPTWSRSSPLLATATRRAASSPPSGRRRRGCCRCARTRCTAR